MSNQSCKERRGKGKQKSRKREQKYEKKKKYSTIPLLGICLLYSLLPLSPGLAIKRFFPVCEINPAASQSEGVSCGRGWALPGDQGMLLEAFLGEHMGSVLVPGSKPHKPCRPNFQRSSGHRLGLGKQSLPGLRGLLFQSYSNMAV